MACVSPECRLSAAKTAPMKSGSWFSSSVACPACLQKSSRRWRKWPRVLPKNQPGTAHLVTSMLPAQNHTNTETEHAVEKKSEGDTTMNSERRKFLQGAAMLGG